MWYTGVVRGPNLQNQNKTVRIRGKKGKISGTVQVRGQNRQNQSKTVLKMVKKRKISGTVQVRGQNRQNQSSVFFCFFCFWAGVCSAGVLRGVTFFFFFFVFFVVLAGVCSAGVLRGVTVFCFLFFLAWVCSAGVLRGVCEPWALRQARAKMFSITPKNVGSKLGSGL